MPPVQLSGSTSTSEQKEIRELETALQPKYGARDRLLGIAEGQNAQSEGTLYFEALRIRGLLLASFRGNEEELETWGFSVKIGTARTGARKKAAAAS